MAKPKLSQSKTYSSPSTARSMDILSCIAASTQGLSLSEIALQLEIPQNSVFRITETLEQLGYLSKNQSNKTFVLTDKLFDLLQPKLNDKHIVSKSYETLKNLRDEYKESVQLIIRVKNKALVLDQFTGIHPVKVTGEIGMKVPIYSCAPGKAIIAALPDNERHAFIRSLNLKAFTPTTLCTVKSLEEEMNLINELGYAIDNEEGLEDIRCVAASILDHKQYPIAALTMIAPAYRFDDIVMKKMGKACKDAASEIMQKL